VTMPSRVTRSPFRRQIVERDTRLRRELRAEMNFIGDIVIGELATGTRRWSHKPKFKKVIIVKPDLIAVNVFTSGRSRANKIFTYVDKGTKQHFIFPRKFGGRLIFKTGYDAKTQPPGKFNAGTGQRFGDFVSKSFVLHPGSKARDFIATIAKKVTPDFRRRIENAMRRGVRRNK